MVYLLTQSMVLWLASIDGARYYDEEDTRTLSEMLDMFVSSCPYFFGAILFFFITIKCSYYGKWDQNIHWIKKCLIVLWWVVAVISGLRILLSGFLLVQIAWTALFEMTVEPIINLSHRMFYWILFIAGSLFVSIGLPMMAFVKWRDKIPRWLALLLSIIASGFLIYMFVFFFITYGERLHLFPYN